MLVQKKLVHVYPGTYVEIVTIDTDVELLKRLAELGFVPGERIHVVVNNWDNYVVVESNRGRFGLPREIAERIIVKELYQAPICMGHRWRGRGKSRKRRWKFW